MAVSYERGSPVKPWPLKALSPQSHCVECVLERTLHFRTANAGGSNLPSGANVAIGGLVGLALKAHVTQARGTLSMEPQVYARSKLLGGAPTYMCGADAGCLAINYQSLYSAAPASRSTCAAEVSPCSTASCSGVFPSCGQTPEKSAITHSPGTHTLRAPSGHPAPVFLSP